MNIEKRWVKMISMAALLLIVVSACDSDEDVESGDEGLYPGRIVDVNLQLDPLWIYEYTNRVREKVNICTGNDDNNTPGWQPGDEVIVNCTLMGESREDFIDYQFATYAVYTETKGGVYKWKLDSKRQLCVKRTVASHGVGGDIPAYDFELKMVTNDGRLVIPDGVSNCWINVYYTPGEKVSDKWGSYTWPLVRKDTYAVGNYGRWGASLADYEVREDMNTLDWHPQRLVLSGFCLRVITEPGATVTLACPRFVPMGYHRYSSGQYEPLEDQTLPVTADMNGNAFFYGYYGYDYTLLAEEFSFTIRTNTGEKKVVPGDEMNIHILEEHRYAFDASDMTEIN